MKILIVYSSRTGNTRKIAEAISSIMPEQTKIYPVAEAPEPVGFDFIALGFWVDKGAPDAAMLKYMEKVKNTKVALFGTLGAYPDSEHAAQSMKNAIDKVEGASEGAIEGNVNNNKVLDTFICQGKIDPNILKAMAKMSEAKNAHPMTDERKARIEEAKQHPNAQDCENAKACFKRILSTLEASHA